MLAITSLEGIGKTPISLYPGQSVIVEGMDLRYTVQHLPIGQRHQIYIDEAGTLNWNKLILALSAKTVSYSSVFCNGFQSWSESREYFSGEGIAPLRSLAHPLMRYYGDTQFSGIRYGKDYLHSWTYTYYRLADNTLVFVGALNEKTAFTLFQHYLTTKTLLIQRDADGWTPEPDSPFFDLFIAQGNDREVFRAWMDTAGISRPKASPMVGWTSWYQYYTNISAPLIEKHVQGFKSSNAPIEVVQVDDGYQTAVGDWLSVKSDFPEGMGALAQQIKNSGYKAGLWLAPFVCDSRSELFKSHPDWLLRHANGRPVRAGYTPLWKGWFYALDFYHPDVQNYLSHVLRIVVAEWGFDLLKLDFLYAVCILPRPEKTRAQILYEALYFIREQVGDTLLLGCGVPLGPTFGLLDYCRIGADIHLKWEHQLLKWLRNRERVSTILSLRSTLGRWQLNGLAFQNDPDVFILRQTNHHLTPTQQTTIWQINAVLGHLLFCSDDLELYEPTQKKDYQQAVDLLSAQVQAVHLLEKDIYRILFDQDGIRNMLFVNLTAKWQQINTPEGAIALEAFGTVILEQ